MKRFFKFSPMLLGGIGVALAVLAAGGFFAVKAIEGNSPPPLTAPVSAETLTPSPAAATSSSSSPPSPTVTPAAPTAPRSRRRAPTCTTAPSIPT